MAWTGSKALYQGAAKLGRGLNSIGKVQVLERKVARPLLPGEGQVGSYKELKEANPVGSNLAAHHMPSANYMGKLGINKQEAITMNVEHPLEKVIPQGRHQQTRTYGGKGRIESGLAPRDELAADIHDMRKIYQQEGNYTAEMKQGLTEVIKQNQTKFPEIFKKVGEK